MPNKKFYNLGKVYFIYEIKAIRKVYCITDLRIWRLLGKCNGATQILRIYFMTE